MEPESPIEHVPLPWGTRFGAAAEQALGRLTDQTADLGTSTGLVDLDELTGGLRPGRLWVIGGRGGVGKSVLARDLVRAALRAGRGCLHLSRRDRPHDVAAWLLAAEGRVPLQHLEHGRIKESDRSRLEQTRGALPGDALVLATCDRLDLRLLTARVDDFDRTTAAACGVVIIDDIPNTADQVAQVAIASELAASRRLAVVAVVQEDIERQSFDMRRFEHMADVLARLDLHDQRAYSTAREGEADLIVSRNRRGPTAVLALAFQGHYGRFVDLQPRAVSRVLGP